MDSSTWHEQVIRGGDGPAAPPRFAHLLERPHLVRLASSLPHGGIIVLVAGPGYGKTAFLRLLADSCTGFSLYGSASESPGWAESALAWAMAGLDPHGVSSDQLSFELGLSPRSPFPPLGGGALSGGELLPGGRVSREVPLVDGPLLMFDDLQDVGRGESGVLSRARLQKLCDRLPSGWLLCLSSRAELPVSLERQAAQGRVITIASRRLRFTPKEVAAWARHALGVTLRTEDARVLWRHTQGWPIALALVASALRCFGTVPDDAGVGRLLARNQELQDYVEANVLSELSSHARAVLGKCSLLARVSFPEDAPVFGLAKAEEARSVLRSLSSRGHLVHSSGGRVFQVHPLVRERTRSLLARDDPRGYEEAVRCAARHLENSGALEQAVSLYLSIDAEEDASAVLHRLADSFLNASVSVPKPEWLLRLPDDVLQRDPSLLLVKGKILQGQGSFVEAATVFRDAARRAQRMSPPEGLVQALLGEAFCLYMLGRWDDSLHVLGRAEKVASGSAEKAEIMCVTGNVLLGQCRWDEAVEKWESALAVLPAAERPAFEARVFCYRTRLFYLRGNYGASAEWARRSVNAASSTFDPAYAVALNVCATALYTLGLYEEAEMRAQSAEALVKAKAWAFLECPVLLTLAGIAQGRGTYGEALKHLHAARAETRRMGDREALVWAEQMLGDVCRQNRNPVRAEAHHRAALALIDEHQLAVFERARASWGVGADLAVQGKTEEGSAVLAQTVALCRTWGLGGTLAQALFYLGWLKAVDNEEAASDRMLAEAVSLMESGGHVHFLLQESAVAVPILALCERLGHGDFLSCQIVPRLPDRLQRYFARLAHGATYPTDVGLGRPSGSRFDEARPAVPVSIPPDPELVERFEGLTARELEILRLISLGMPNKVIAAKLFITEKTIKTHTNRMYKKLGVMNRVQAVLAFQSYMRHSDMGCSRP